MEQYGPTSADSLSLRKRVVTLKTTLYKIESGVEYKARLRVRRLLAAKGPEASRLFWKHVPGIAKKSALDIEYLEKQGDKCYDAKEKTQIIENHFIRKFEA